MTQEVLTDFFGWCALINLGLILLSTLMLVGFKDTIMDWHSRLFDINRATLPNTYFNYLASYKIGVLLFNLVPYLTLKIMSMG